MDEIFVEYQFTIWDIVLFLGGLSILFLVYASLSNLGVTVQDNVNEKSNVFEISEEYSDTQHEINGSSIPGDILRYEPELTVVIGGYTVPDSVRKKLIEYHNASEIISKISPDKKYEKKYEMDEEGNITKVLYQ